MILGILAAVAAPKLLGTSGTATDNGLRQTLGVVRDAIERYAAENGGEYPGADGLKRLSRPTSLRTCAAHSRPARSATTRTTKWQSPTRPSTPLGVDAAATKGWRYSYATGDFIVNSADNDNSDTPVAYNTY